MDDHDAVSHLSDRKRLLRASARTRRAAADADNRAEAAASWTTQLLGLDVVRSATVVAAYASYGTEPPTADLVAALTARGVRVLLPVLLEDRDLDWTIAGAPPGATPLGRDAIATADVIVVPALAVGTDGVRLGQGGGSYDRALARTRAGTPVVALVHDDEVVAPGVLPEEAHDRRVTHAVTPTGAMRIDPEPIDPDLTASRRWDTALVVACGGAIGALARWGINEAFPHDASAFPWATFVENVSGALVLGVLMVLLLEVWRPLRYARPFLAVGVLGGFTTFSTYTVDTRVLLADGQGVLALSYLFGTLALGLLATWAGLAGGRAIAGVPQRPLRPVRQEGPT